MNTLALQKSLIERMPKVEGTYTENYNLARHMWFKVGGPAEIAFEPKGLADLSYFLAERPGDVPITVIGYALIRDGGIPGVVIRLGRAFDDIAIGENKIAAGAGALAISVARAAQRKGLAGLEFLSGIPGGIGGALRMNAGAYGREMKDVVLRARAVDLAHHARTHREDAARARRGAAAPATPSASCPWTPRASCAPAACGPPPCRRR